MRMTDLIAKKRDGERLTTEEISEMIRLYTAGEIPDYQMSAMCMAILFRGMDDGEILDLTMSMMHSGETLDLSPIRGVKADKHSTGGVGDKTSLVLCPMVAACGVKIAKMSGRGLGHTGGTIDKLESFPGFVTGISEQRFFDNVNRIGIALAGQTAEVCPADKKLYALRDVTGTVPSIPLIVSSIMSKKLAAGADVIVLDVKCGSGAFMKTPEQARELAEGLTRVGNLAGRRCAAVITDMDEPLGFAVGNALEVKEAVDVLAGRTEAGELKELCLTLGANILTLAGLAEDEADARAKLEKTIEDGSALKKLAEMVEAQYGDLCGAHRGRGRGSRLDAPRRRARHQGERDRPLGRRRAAQEGRRPRGERREPGHDPRPGRGKGRRGRGAAAKVLYLLRRARGESALHQRRRPLIPKQKNSPRPQGRGLFCFCFTIALRSARCGPPRPSRR